MSRVFRFAFCFALLLAAVVAHAQTEMSAIYIHHALEVSIPYPALHEGPGRLQVELLDPEDKVLAQSTRTLNAESAGGFWKVVLAPDRALSFDNLVWQRISYSFIPTGDSKPAFKQIRSVSTILRRPVVHILGQTNYLSGSTAALRIIVSDSTWNSVPIDSGTVHIELMAPQQTPRMLFTGKLDHRGTANAQFGFPAGLTGNLSLRVTVETSVGTTETTQVIHLEDKVAILLTTEKPIYQPSQTIHVRALALDRVDHHATAAQKLIFELEDARGNKIFRNATETDSFGVASAEIPLADEVNLGAWHLRASMPAGNDDTTPNHAELALQVERYVLPKFRVSINFTKKDGKPQRDFRPGDHVTGTVEAKYFFGKPVSDASLSLEATGMDAGTFKAAKSEGHTDADGIYHFDLTLPSYFAGRSTNQGAAPVLIEATVKDTAGHAETRGEPITVTESALLIQAIPEGGNLIPGLDNVVYVMTSYPDGTPASATVRIHTKDNDASSVETAANGIGIVHLRGNTANQQLRCDADDHHGKRTSTSVRLGIRLGEDQVLLRTDRAIYRPGDTIKLDILSTKPTGSVYIDLIKDGQTVLTRDVDLTAGRAELSVPATPSLSGTLDANAYIFGADSRPVRDHRLLFIQPANDLHIEAHADAASYLPGSEAHIHFHVTDSRGKGVESALGLQIVDEAVFALAEKQPGFAKVFFYLEEELMKPRFEIHSVSPLAILSPNIEGPTAVQLEGDSAARVLFSAAETLNPHTLDATFGNALPTGGRDTMTARYLDVLTDQAAVIANQLHKRSVTASTVTSDFASLHNPDGSSPHDAWDTPLHLERAYWTPQSRYFRLISAGPDRKFGTADDLTVNLDPLAGRIIQYGTQGVIPFRIEHDRGPDNGLAEVSGTVTDPSGAAIPGARIALQSLASNHLRHTEADNAGNFTFSALPIGKYTVTITSPAFVAATRTLDLAARDQAILTPTLQVGAVAETIEAAGAPMMVMDAIVENLPMRFRAVGSASSNASPIVSFKAMASAPATATTQTEAHTRSYFPEALFIAPEIITDSHGVASVTIPMADSITTWRMAMFASTKSGALGTASSSLKVFQDFFVDLDLPVTITEGDRISLPVAVYNYTGGRGTVQLHLQKEDWFDISPTESDKTVAVDGNNVGSAQFTLQAKHIGHFKLTLTAHMGDRNDSVVREIEVVPNGQPRETVFNGRLDANAQGSVTQTVTTPPDSLPEASKLFVRIYPGPMSQLIEGMDGILHMPYGCFEQTSSSTYPNVLALDYMKRTKKLTPETHAKAEGFIATGYQRLLTFEVPGGGFSWFGQAPANKILTAYGLMEFHDMSTVHDVDPRVIERTRNWLIGQQQPDGSWKPDTKFINEGATNRFNTDLIRITAYIAWSLAVTGYEGPALTKAQTYLQQQLADSNAKPDAYTLAVLANFAVDSKADLTWTHSIFDRLLDTAQHGDDQLWWTSEQTGLYGSGTSAAVETTGLAVQALLKAGEQNEAARKALAWLLSKKSGAGNWGSTQATIMALRALVMASEKSGGDATGSVDILLNGQTFANLQLTPANNDLLHQFALPATSSDRIELRFHGAGSLAYQINGRYFIPWSARDKKSNALSIDVAYDRTKLKESDIVAATATIRSNLNATANMVMVDLGIPPGFELQTDDLQNMLEKTAHASTGKLEKFNLTATQAILYFNSIGAGETVKIHFHLRAKYPIRAHTFESKVYEYYDPSVQDTAPPVWMEAVAN